MSMQAQTHDLISIFCKVSFVNICLAQNNEPQELKFIKKFSNPAKSLFKLQLLEKDRKIT